MFHNDREQVTIDHLVCDTNTLARVFDRFSPDPGIPEPLDKFTMKLVTDILDRTPPADDEGFLEVSFATVGF